MRDISINDLTEIIIGLAIKVHRELGAGFLESVYQAALAFELEKAEISFEKEKPLSVIYGEIKLDVGFRFQRIGFLSDLSDLCVSNKASKRLIDDDYSAFYPWRQNYGSTS